MNATKAKRIRKSVARKAEYIDSLEDPPDGWQRESWYYYDRAGALRLGPCERKLYQATKRLLAHTPL